MKLKQPTMTAIVNPFTREVKIIHEVPRIKYNERIVDKYELELVFDDTDEWQGFDTDKQYDMHFYYEDGSGFDLCVYPVKGNQTDTQNSVPVKVKIVYQTLADNKTITYICKKQKQHGNKLSR